MAEMVQKYLNSRTCSRISKRNLNTWLFNCHVKKPRAHTPHNITSFSLLDVCSFIHLLQIKSRLYVYRSGVLQCPTPLLEQHPHYMCQSSIVGNSLSQLWCGQWVSFPFYGGKKKRKWRLTQPVRWWML